MPSAGRRRLRVPAGMGRKYDVTTILKRGGTMNFIVNLLILLPARIASYFAWAGPLIMRLIGRLRLHADGLGQAQQSSADDPELHRLGHSVPHILTPFVSGVECFGGIMLILGLFTRIPAAMLAVVMVVAIKSAKWGDVDSLETLAGFRGSDLFCSVSLARDRWPRRCLAGSASRQCCRAPCGIDLTRGLTFA